MPTQSPQEVAEGAASLLAKSRLGLRRLFLHPCFTVGYGSKDHSPLPYLGLLAAVYGDGRPVRRDGVAQQLGAVVQGQFPLQVEDCDVANAALVDIHGRLPEWARKRRAG